MTEHQLQVQCVTWFKLVYKNKLIFAVPNGGRTSIGTAVKLKKEGMLSGVPDLFIAEPTKHYAGLFIEMKNGKKGVLSNNQKEVIKMLSLRGYRVEVARSFDEFQDIINWYLKEWNK